LSRTILTAGPLLSEPDDASVAMAMLEAGDELRILDNSRGWAWGYGPGGGVGYVRSVCLIP